MQLDKVLVGGPSISAFDFAWTPAATAAGQADEQTVDVAAPWALRTTDAIVVVSLHSAGNDTFIGAARVTDADTIAVKVVNISGGALTHAAGTFRCIVVRG